MKLHHQRGTYTSEEIPLFVFGQSYFSHNLVITFEKQVDSMQGIQDIQTTRNTLEENFLERMIASAGYYSINGAPLSCLVHYGTRTRKPRPAEIKHDIQRFGEAVLSQEGPGTKVKVRGDPFFYNGAPRIFAGVFTTALFRQDSVTQNGMDDLEKIISRGELLDHENFLLIQASYGVVNLNKSRVIQGLNSDGITLGKVSLERDKVIFSSTGGKTHDYTSLL
jgi:hypothetical protein